MIATAAAVSPRAEPSAEEGPPSLKLDYLGHGQIVIVAARWVLVALGLLLTLWRPADLFALQVSIGVILAAAVANFFLHTRILNRKPVRRELVYAASAADILLISILVAVGSGFQSDVFVYYFPAVLAFALVFPPPVTVLFSAGTLMLYTGLVIAAGPGIGWQQADAQVLVARLLTLAGIAVVAVVSLYREYDRRRTAESATSDRIAEESSAGASDPAQERRLDVWYGQAATIWARWALIGSGLLLTLWGASEIGELQVKVLLFLPLLALNFYMHGRYFTDRRASRILVYGASLVDLVVITLMIATAWGGQPGLANPFFIFYYPVVLAFALVFPHRITIPFASALAVIYAAICLFATPSFDLGGGDDVTLTGRLVTLLATAGLGTLYWRIQRRRRASAARQEQATDVYDDLTAAEGNQAA